MKIELDNLDAFMDPHDLEAHLELVHVKLKSLSKYLDYGYAKTIAMRDRINGDIPAALNQEKYCDVLYANLPADVKVW